MFRSNHGVSSALFLPGDTFTAQCTYSWFLLFLGSDYKIPVRILYLCALMILELTWTFSDLFCVCSDGVSLDYFDMSSLFSSALPVTPLFLHCPSCSTQKHVYCTIPELYLTIARCAVLILLFWCGCVEFSGNSQQFREFLWTSLWTAFTLLFRFQSSFILISSLFYSFLSIFWLPYHCLFLNF